MCARTVAAHIPFEVVEQMMPPVPEQLQLLIAFWSFPENEEDIRLYSCLANGNADEFLRGENHYKHKSVHDPLQIGEPSCNFFKRNGLFSFDILTILTIKILVCNIHSDPTLLPFYCFTQLFLSFFNILIPNLLV